MDWDLRYYDASDRLIDRQRIIEGLQATEAGLFTHMSILVTQMGANLRAYHFLCNQAISGYRRDEKIDLLEVKELVEKVVEWKWVNPGPYSRYEKYFPEDGDLGMVVDDFKGRARLKAFWDVTGYAVTKALRSEPGTMEQYLKSLAVFWSMNAPVELPSLPGIGMKPTLFSSIHIPTTLWEFEELEKCQIKPIPPEELAVRMTFSSRGSKGFIWTEREARSKEFGNTVSYGQRSPSFGLICVSNPLIQEITTLL